MRLMSDWRRAALLRRLLRKVAAAWYKALLVLSVRSWSCWSLARRSLRRSRSSVRERHRRALLSSALSVWQQRLLTSWSLKAREQRLHQISHAFVQRRALRLWHTELCLVRHRRLSLDLAVCHHASHLQRSAFRALKKHVRNSSIVDIHCRRFSTISAGTACARCAAADESERGARTFVAAEVLL